ncbi:hypothetical protein [Methanosarcina horonobensis]|uniref:hypothetical protein n=1 Tax=Methanosarcina horonobensis TaxID=418008 RepID=UPI00064FFECE|nr:hypothetical protein [Methanosarcina horonobensis]
MNSPYSFLHGRHRPYRLIFQNYRHKKQYAKSERAGRLYFSRDVYSTGTGDLRTGPRHHWHNLAGRRV